VRYATPKRAAAARGDERGHQNEPEDRRQSAHGSVDGIADGAGHRIGRLCAGTPSTAGQGSDQGWRRDRESERGTDPGPAHQDARDRRQHVSRHGAAAGLR